MKRFGVLSLIFMLPVLVACKILPPVDAKPPENQQIAATNDVAAVSVGKLTATTVRPKPRPNAPEAKPGPAPSLAATPAPEMPVAEPATQKSTAQLVCEKKGGIWGNAGSAKLQSCIKRTRDGGKQCRKAGDCESACLARSGTCAPVKPLFGCNEILQKDGSRVTLCLD